MTDERLSQGGSILELFRPVVLPILISISGIVVWSFYHLHWSGFLTYLIVGFFAGSVAGGLCRVPLISSWAVMGLSGGLFIGACEGWKYGSWVGAAATGFIGLVGGLVVAMLLSMTLSFVLVMRGIDPFVSADEKGEAKSKVS